MAAMRLLGLAFVAAFASVMCGAEALPMDESMATLAEDGSMADALMAINAQVAKSEKEEMAKSDGDAVPRRGLSLDQEIEMAGELRYGKKKAAVAHPDLGESASVSAKASQAAAKAGLAEAIAEAQAAMKKAQAAQVEPTVVQVDNAEIQAEVHDDHMDSEDMGEDNEVDPIDAMMSQIDNGMKQDFEGAEEERADPLDSEIDQIAVVRKRLAVRSKVRDALDAAQAQMEKAKGAIDMIEVEEGAEPAKKADTTPAADKSMPPGKRAPPGPPLPKVEEVEKEIPQAKALGRSTPSVADPAAAMAALAASRPKPQAALKPEDALKKLPGGFSKEQVMSEIKALEAYPMTEAEAKKEFEAKQIPLSQRKFAAKPKPVVVVTKEKKPDPKKNPLTAEPVTPAVEVAAVPASAPPPAPPAA